MSDDTTAVETPETADEVEPFFLEAWNVNLIPTKPRKKKGSKEETSYYYPDLKGRAVIDFLVKTIDIDKLGAALMREIIRPAASEATNNCRVVNPETGLPDLDPLLYVKAFDDQFEPASRRAGGENKKDLIARVQALTPELCQLVIASGANPNDSSIKNRMAMVLLEINELNAKIEAKSRGPQTPRKPKKAKAVKAPEAVAMAA